MTEIERRWNTDLRVGDLEAGKAEESHTPLCQHSNEAYLVGRHDSSPPAKNGAAPSTGVRVSDLSLLTSFIKCNHPDIF